MAVAEPAHPSAWTNFIRWLRLKNYQYEVTYALYMLTPMEKFVFNTLLLLVTSMFLVAAYIYLPDHVISICQHIWYYWAGNDPFPPSMTSDFNSNLSTALAGGPELHRSIRESATLVAETTTKRFAEL